MVERLLAPTRDDHPCPALEQLARYLKSNPARPASHERALSGNIHTVPHINQNQHLGNEVQCASMPARLGRSPGMTARKSRRTGASLLGGPTFAPFFGLTTRLRLRDCQTAAVCRNMCFRASSSISAL